MSEHKPSIEKLEKQIRVLQRKLERSEWHRIDLENQHDRDQHLYRRLHAELEAAHREAEVEAALERVRARAMAMHSSEELLDVIFKIHQEYSDLGLPCGAFWQTRYTPESYYKALTGIDGRKLAAIMELPRDFASNPALAAWERGDEKIGVFKFDADAACQYLHHMIAKGKFDEVDPAAITEEMVRENDGWTFVQARTSHGEIGYSLWGETEPSQEAKDVLVRFARTFDLAYRRFEDLQQAEAQAREAQIEAALERVRSRTMAMQSSDELREAANLLFQQVQSLGMPAWSAGYCIWDDDKQGITLWMSSEGVLQPPVWAPLTDDPAFIHMREAHEREETFYVEEMGGEALVEHYRYMRTLPVVGDVLDSIIAAGHPLPTFQIFHLAFFSHGFLLFITYEPVPEAHDIFKRFGRSSIKPTPDSWI